MSLPIPPGADLSLVPALSPPPEVTPNFSNPVSRADAVLTANGVITAVMLLFVFARLFAKGFYARSQLGWEDAFCLAGTTISLGYVGLVAHVFHFGFGPHQWDVPLSALLDTSHIKALKAVNFLYGPMMICTKLSILLLFFRLFSPSKEARIWIYVGIATTLLIHVVGTILAIVLCIPSDALGYSRCANRLNILDVVISGLNILSDFYILILPMIVVSKLQMQRNRKLGVLAVFSTGVL
ncbi:MAG: hypothetical protein Q9181_004834 [Wetmoreana brouardii]